MELTYILNKYGQATKMIDALYDFIYNNKNNNIKKNYYEKTLNRKLKKFYILRKEVRPLLNIPLNFDYDSYYSKYIQKYTIKLKSLTFNEYSNKTIKIIHILNEIEDKYELNDDFTYVVIILAICDACTHFIKNNLKTTI